MNHTPTPWRWNENDQIVSTHEMLDHNGEKIFPVIVETDSGFYAPHGADKEFIVKACNEHDAMVSERNQLADYLDLSLKNSTILLDTCVTLKSTYELLVADVRNLCDAAIEARAALSEGFPKTAATILGRVLKDMK